MIQVVRKPIDVNTIDFDNLHLQLVNILPSIETDITFNGQKLKRAQYSIEHTEDSIIILSDVEDTNGNIEDKIVEVLNDLPTT